MTTIISTFKIILKFCAEQRRDRLVLSKGGLGPVPSLTIRGRLFQSGFSKGRESKMLGGLAIFILSITVGLKLKSRYPSRMTQSPVITSNICYTNQSIGNWTCEERTTINDSSVRTIQGANGSLYSFSSLKADPEKTRTRISILQHWWLERGDNRRRTSYLRDPAWPHINNRRLRRLHWRGRHRRRRPWR